MTAIEEIELEMNSEWRKIARTPFMHKPIGLLEIVRAIDDLFCFYSYALPNNSKEKQEWYEYFKTHSNGFYEWFENFDYNDEIDQKPTIFFVSTAASKQWANYSLIQSGKLGFVYRFVQLAKQGIFNVERVDSQKFEFKYILTSTGAEFVESLYQKRHLTNLFETSFNERFKVLEAVVEQELPNRVSIWNHDFIKYESSSTIDEFYLLYGKALCNGFVGYDTFEDQSVFNGIPYGTIKQVISAFIGSTKKHFDFCQVALAKFGLKRLNQWNLYTTPFKRVELIELISKESNVNIEAVEWVIDLLTLNKSNISIHLGAPGSSLPPLFKLDKEWVLRSVAGSLSNPFTYLNRCLKSSYNNDYSKAVNLREERFRNEFNNLFDSNRILKCNKSVVLKSNGVILTDIDSMLYDTEDETLLLVQLKWMDDFGTSMKQRASMEKNFYEPATKWINKTDEWLECNAPIQLLKYFDEDCSSSKIKKVFRLVLGRHFAHFSDKKTDEKSLWCGWPQLVHIIQNKKSNQSLSEIVKEVQKESITQVNLTKLIPDTKYEVGKYIVTIKFK
ncbi:MAG: hypothetical protein J7502_09345 [Flavisolibacter sp.]|nr:hypothetical protein [Flavisolibacter sp.]